MARYIMSNYTPQPGTSNIHDDDVARVSSDYQMATLQLAALLKQAGEAGGHLERLGHGLSTHPERMVIARSEEHIGGTGGLDVISSRAIPAVDELVALTDSIRDLAAQVNDLRERLILLGHPELVEPPTGFFQ